MKKIGLLLVGHIDAGSLHVGGDYPELYADILGPQGIELTTYRCDEGQMPDSLIEQDGWMCSPSRLSVYDDHAWLRDVEQLLRDMVAKESPYVGICFGHQLMGQALGATVAKADYGWALEPSITKLLLHSHGWIHQMTSCWQQAIKIRCSRFPMVHDFSRSPTTAPSAAC